MKFRDEIGCGKKQADALDDLGKSAERNRSARKENQWEPDELIDDLSFLHRVGDAGDDEAQGSESHGAQGNQEEGGDKIAETRNVKNETRKEHFDKDRGHGEDEIGDDAGGQHVTGGNRRNVKPAQDSLFAKHDQSGAESPEAAHDGQGHDGPKKIADHLGDALREDSGVKKEKTEGHDHAEK